MPGRYDSAPMDCKVYVGDLGSSTSKQDLEDAFSYYGHVRNVWIAKNPPGFAFIEFEDARDAEDSVQGLDGRSICGRRVRVEMSTGRRKGGGGYRGGGGYGGRRPPPRGRPSMDERCYECGERGHFARDCRNRGRSSGGYRSSRRRRSYSRSRSRSYSRSSSRSRSRSPRKR